MLLSAVQHESAIRIHISPPSWPSPNSSHPTALGHHGAPSWAPCTVRQLAASCLTHGSVYMSMLLSQSVPPSPSHPSVHMFILYVCISIPALQLESSTIFLGSIHMCCCLVAKSCLTLYNVMDYSLPGFSDHRISQARILERVTIPSPGYLPDRGIKPVSLELAGGFFTTEPPGNPHMCVNVRCLFFSFQLHSVRL